MTRRIRCFLLVLPLIVGCTLLVDIDKTVVAEVGREKIRLGDVVERISRTPPERKLAANTHEGRLEILEDLINEMLLLQAADAAGITVSDEEVQQRIQQEQATVRATGGGAGQETLVQSARDPETMARILRMEKVVSPHVTEDSLFVEYQKMLDGPPAVTVQYEFISVRARNPAFALDVERELQAGKSAIELVSTYRGHPDFVNGGRPAPVLAVLLAPWLQQELQRHEVGDLLPAWQTETAGEPTIQLVRFLNAWPYPPFEVVRDVLVDEAYQSYLTELKADTEITRYPERLNLIDRR